MYCHVKQNIEHGEHAIYEFRSRRSSFLKHIRDSKRKGQHWILRNVYTCIIVYIGQDLDSMYIKEKASIQYFVKAKAPLVNT